MQAFVRLNSVRLDKQNLGVVGCYFVVAPWVLGCFSRSKFVFFSFFKVCTQGAAAARAVPLSAWLERTSQNAFCRLQDV